MYEVGVHETPKRYRAVEGVNTPHGTMRINRFVYGTNTKRGSA